MWQGWGAWPEVWQGWGAWFQVQRAANVRDSWHQTRSWTPYSAKRIFSVEDGMPLVTGTLVARARHLSWSRDGRLVAVGCDNKEAR